MEKRVDDQASSLALSQRLKDLGVKQDSYLVMTRHVLKDHVFAYLGGRGEQEIVIRSKYLKEK